MVLTDQREIQGDISRLFDPHATPVLPYARPIGMVNAIFRLGDFVAHSVCRLTDARSAWVITLCLE
jgi:hypothetical protein